MTNDDIKSAIAGKNILITGGTGSFGKQILLRLLEYSPATINIFSRDEKKQYEMRQSYLDHNELIFSIGDVRDYDRVHEVMLNIDIVYHAAALKQVPSCEGAPFEAVRTNIIGAENIRRAAIRNGVDTVISISTDKAVKPVNVMGMSKAIQERIMLNQADKNESTRFLCVRYGNVLGSRGSIVPLFHNLIMNRLPLRITHPGMTRFQLTLDEAVELVLWAAVKGENGDLWVRKMPAAKIIDIATALAYGLTGKTDYPHEIVGARAGEKMHEVLVSEEEMWRASEFDDYFMIPTFGKSLAEKGPSEGPFSEYSSDSVEMLSVDELAAMLDSEGWFNK